jgi:ADP-ribose pyrophosphatase YjhB (NUDIX family)
MQSALRELKEETGVDGDIKGIIAVRETIRSGMPALFIAYSIHPRTTDVTIDNEEISDFGWFDITEIESVNFISKTMKSIAKCALMKAPHMLCIDGSDEAKSPYYLHVQNSDF